MQGSPAPTEDIIYHEVRGMIGGDTRFYPLPSTQQQAHITFDHVFTPAGDMDGLRTKRYLSKRRGRYALVLAGQAPMQGYKPAIRADLSALRVKLVELFPSDDVVVVAQGQIIKGYHPAWSNLRGADYFRTGDKRPDEQFLYHLHRLETPQIDPDKMIPSVWQPK